jgi:hypothetical protein
MNITVDIVLFIFSIIINIHIIMIFYSIAVIYMIVCIVFLLNFYLCRGQELVELIDFI